MFTLPAAADDPAVPAMSGAGQRIVYSKPAQRVWLVEADETVAATFLASGRMTLRDRVRTTCSPSAGHGPRMEYMVRFAQPRRLAIGFHSIPVNRRGWPIQTDAELGKPRSSGCVRMRLSDAAQLWDWAPVGTLVVVLG